MLSGRHLVALGLLACAGLLSVRDSQEQVRLGYRIAAQEAELRKAREAIAKAQIRLDVMQTPARVLRRARELNLEVQPASALALYETDPGEALEDAERTQ